MPTQNIKLADPVTYMRLANEAILTRDPLGVTLILRKIANTEAGLNPLVYLLMIGDYYSKIIQ